MGPKDAERVRIGNRLALFSLRCLKLCLKMGVGCTVEQPSTSWMLKLPPFVRFLRRQGVTTVTFDYCMYGEKWRKRTTLIVVGLGLECLRRPCSGDHAHQNLR